MNFSKDKQVTLTHGDGWGYKISYSDDGDVMTLSYFEQDARRVFEPISIGGKDMILAVADSIKELVK